SPSATQIIAGNPQGTAGSSAQPKPQVTPQGPSAPLGTMGPTTQSASLNEVLKRPLPANYEAGTNSDGSFIELVRRGYNSEQHYTQGDGWKFHLSIHPDDVPRALDLVAPILMENGVGAIKVATPQNISFYGPQASVAGKQITIYGAGK